MSSPLFETTPVDLPTQATAVYSEERQRLEKKMSDLSPQERSQLEASKKSLIATDFNSITNYTKATSTLASSVVDSVLKVANSTELDHLGGGVNRILLSAKQIDAAQLTNAPHSTFLKRLFPWFFTTKEKIAARFASVGTQIEKYAQELRKDLAASQASITVLQNLEKDCVQKYHVLEVSILAGAVRADELRVEFAAEQERLKALPPEQVDPLQTQELQRKWQYIDTLEKQVAAQQQYQQVVYMQIPQLAMSVKNSVDISAEFNQILDLTLPLWKQQFAHALILEQQRKATAVIKDNKDFTNQMLKSTADNLKAATLEIREQGARGLIEKETLEYVQTQFIQTMEGALAIHNKARESRAQLSQSIDKMRSDFKTQLQSY